MMLAVGLCLTMSACGGGSSMQQDDVTGDDGITGGVTDRTDATAPKTIASKEITAFACTFYLYDAYDAARDGSHTYEIDEDEEGRYLLTESGVFSHTTEISADELTGLQEIIDRYDLAEKNGVYKYTAALPPEYAPWELDVSYASGECLYFYEDGEPDADWTREMKDYFDDLFEAAGYTDMLPAAEDVTIDDLFMHFSAGERCYAYGFETGDDDIRYFYREIYDTESGETLSLDWVQSSDAMLEDFQDVIEDCDLEALPPSSDGGSVQTNVFVDILINYQSGRQVYREYYDEDIPEDWEEKRDALMSVMDQYLAQDAMAAQAMRN